MKFFKFFLISIFLLSLNAVFAQSNLDSIKKNEPGSIFSSKALNLSGYTQVRYQHFTDTISNNGFDVRRVRLKLDGEIAKGWSYKTQLDFAAKSPLIDAVISYKFNDHFIFSAGQASIPLSGQNLEADTKLFTIDRSLPVEYLAARGKDVIGNQNGRDIGLFLNGKFLKKDDFYRIDYYLALMNGNGINAPDGNRKKDLGGRIIFHPIKNMDIGGAFYNGYYSVGTTNPQRIRYGGEFKYTYKPLSFNAEYLQGQNGDTKLRGYFAELSSLFYQDKLQVVGRYEYMDPTVNLDSISPVFMHDALTNYVFGVNVLFNRNVKLLINYTLRREQTTQVNNDLIASQLQILF